MADAGIEARRVHYSGRVQGVGFRYTARRIAQGHAVTGYVRNLDDGRVELVAEGTANVLDAVLNEIDETMADNIRHATIEQVPVTGKYRAFDVAF